MSTESDFIVSIVEHSNEDAYRLVFADWLEDHDQSERATFIRLHCELASLPDCDVVVVPDAPNCGCRRCDLSKRVRKMFNNDSPSDKRFPIFGVPKWCYLSDNESELEVIEHPTPFKAYAVVRRGFVAVLHIPYMDFMRHSEAIRARHPVERVVFTTDPIWDGLSVHEVFDGITVYWLKGEANPRQFTEAEVDLASPGKPLDITKALLRLRWPGIEFVLPERDREIPWDEMD